MAVSYAEQVVKLMVSFLMVGKGTDETDKELNTQKMGGASLIHKTVTFRDMSLWQHKPHWWLIPKLIKDDGHDQSDAPSLSGTRISNHQVTCSWFTQMSCTTEESSPWQLQNLTLFSNIFLSVILVIVCLFLHSMNNVIVLKSFSSADEYVINWRLCVCNW